MIYHFVHYFDSTTPYAYRNISDKVKLEIAKKKAAEDLAKYLLEKCGDFQVNDNGDVEGTIEIT